MAELTDEQLRKWSDDPYDFPNYWEDEHGENIAAMAKELLAAREWMTNMCSTNQHCDRCGEMH